MTRLAARAPALSAAAHSQAKAAPRLSRGQSLADALPLPRATRQGATGLALTALTALGLWAMADAARAETVTTSHGYSNFGELRYGPEAAHLDYVNPDAPKGGEISQWGMGSFDSFNRYSRKGVSASLTELMYESLMTATADDPYGMYCYLCETIEYPDSLDWVIFNLRDDVTFSDGTPMTAEDVKYTHELFMEQGITEYVAVVKNFVEAVEVLGPHQIKFTFTDSAPRRDVISFAGGSTVFSKDWFEETGARLDESTLTPFLGTGPYLIQSYDVGRQIIYGRNETFWGAAHPFNIGQNNFDRIRIEYFADSTSAFEAFKAGVYTFRNENTSKTWATGYDFRGVRNGWIKKEELHDGAIGTAQSWVFNLDRPVWQDASTREAVRLMFNFEWSNKSLFYGLYDRVNSFWENSPLEATGTPTEAEQAILQPLVDQGLLDASILTDEAIMAPVNVEETNQPDRRTRRQALRLLAEAGWEPGEDGLLRRDGQTLTLSILSYSAAFDRIINPYVENLRGIGIDAKLERVDVSQYTTRRRDGDFDLTTHSFAMGFEPGFGLRQWYGSETADDSSRNLMRLRDPAVDSLITTVTEAKTLDDLTTAVHALDRVLRAGGFWVPQWNKSLYTVAYYDMYRHPDPLPPLALGHLSFWWYDAEAAAQLKADGAL